MGILRVILAVAVLSAHAGPLFGLNLLRDSALTAVESFFIISGFYMALVLHDRYQNRLPDFYFNRFLRIFPAYWITLIGTTAISLIYWLVSGHPLGFLASWIQDFPTLQRLAAGFSNLTVFGTDLILAWSHHPGTTSPLPDRLIAHTAMWSVAVELLFYACAPWFMRLRPRSFAWLLALAIACRVGLQNAYPDEYVQWVSRLPFGNLCLFLGGMASFKVYARLQQRPWFTRWSPWFGWSGIGLLVALILGFEHQSIIALMSPVYYGLFVAILPFAFAATRYNDTDQKIGTWSYPIYLTHGTAMAVMPPLRHFIDMTYFTYFVLLFTLVFSGMLIAADARIQGRFKHLGARRRQRTSAPPPARPRPNLRRTQKEYPRPKNSLTTLGARLALRSKRGSKPPADDSVQC